MLDKEDMEAIKYAFNEALKPMRDEMNAKFDAVNERLDRIEEDVTSMKEDIEQLKEDSEITRGATNEIIEWIDVYFREQNKPFPVDRKTPIPFEG